MNAGDCTLYEAIGRLYEERDKRGGSSSEDKIAMECHDAIGNLLWVIRILGKINNGPNHDAICEILERIRKKF